MKRTSSRSRELAGTWRTMVAGLEARSSLKEETPRLSDYAFGHFNPKMVIERLLEPDPTYFALKDILFAGLCVWTVCPYAVHLIEDAMVLAGISRMAELEEDRKAQLPQDALLADIVARLSGPGIDFYRDFYYPMGGLNRILHVRSPDLLQQAVSFASKNIGFEVEMVRVCHYHALYLQNTAGFRVAGVTRSGVAVSRLLKKIESRTSINPILRDNRPRKTVDPVNCRKKAAPYIRSAALIYAASSIAIGNESFLQMICKGNISFKEHGAVLLAWLGRAVYAANTIIEPMYYRESSADQIQFLPNIDPILIDPPEFGEETQIVRDAFDVRLRDI
ncbi:hypothetical protein [Methylobacterium sp. Leaf113]|uniref:hypothetical protein n=1 Tax=Methylobacterium sp. Leaf113 TaxID=1736259 RepID=UPI000B290FC6|nr:hypothetical protein [Methylobacterium sp. Leaf113]